jgi:hypothetical protein
MYDLGQWFLAGKGRRKFLVVLAIILTSVYMNTCIKHLDKYFVHVGHRYFWFFVRSQMTPKKTNLWIFSLDLWRHIFVTSFLLRVYDVIFLWRHFSSGFMTSYFCDVISSPGLWRHIFVTSFLRWVYNVIFFWRHFFAGFMTSYFWDVISSPDLWRHICVTSFLLLIYDVISLWRHFLTGVMNFLQNRSAKSGPDNEFPHLIIWHHFLTSLWISSLGLWISSPDFWLQRKTVAKTCWWRFCFSLHPPSVAFETE